MSVLQYILSRPDLNVNYQDGQGYTALHIAAKLDAPENVKLLLEDGRINLALKDEDEKTAYHIAYADQKKKAMHAFEEHAKKRNSEVR